MMLRLQLFFVTTLFLCSSLLAQQGLFQGAEIDYPANETLERQFFDYKVYRINADAFNTYVKDHSERSERELTLRLGNDYAWNLQLSPYEIRGQNFKTVIATEQGNRILPWEETKVYRGHINADLESQVTMTIDDDFIYGMVKKGNELFFIEPLRFFSGTADDLFIVYNAEDVKPNTEGTCAYDDMLHEAQHQGHEDHEGHEEELGGVSNRMGCKEVETAIAADFSMYLKYNSNTSDVQNRIFGVYGNVQTNYDNEFDDQIVFLIVETFISTCATCDPWTTSTNAGNVLGSFTNWGPSGFSTPHDLGSFWTNRNFNGGTIGIAWLASICSSSRYHAIQDFSNNASLMRVLVAHEIGHNFAAGHDAGGAPFIMAPSVNTSNAWSSNSQNSINNFVPTRSCLQNCNIILPPVADFVANPSNGCAPLTVGFNDISQNNPDTWQWIFPGGTPATSNQQNPTVVYDVPGTYDVSLTVTNSAGNNTVTRTSLIVVDGPPTPIFTSNVIMNGVTFNNLTTNATSYFWDFGDGVGTSVEENPSYVYAQDGIYLVSLTAFNACGEATFEDFVVIETVPFAAFMADTLKGCDSLEVQFIDQSTSNAVNWAWSIPGAIPDTSNLQNPSVLYPSPGTYTVSLIVSNGAGANQVVRTDYITVCESASAGFDFSVDSLTVFFNNSSTGDTSLLWDFGDGNTSTTRDPVHTYASGGDYEVTLIAYGDAFCGPDTVVQTISLAVLPTAAFSADTIKGCVKHTVDFVDESSNADSWQWSFPGGSPAVSTDQFPIVEYDSAGIFDVTLVVTNSIGTDTFLIEKYIQVDTVPTADFDFVIDANNSLLVQFSDSSSFVDSLFWDFGDGTVSRDTNPSHTYAQDGVYTVELIIKNECGADTTERDVTIVTLPSAAFSSNINTACAPADILFTDESSTNATSWSWSFPGAQNPTSMDQNPTVFYNTAGVYDVTLIVSNAAGSDTTTITGAITIEDVPVAGFSNNISGFDVTFLNSSTDATSYLWDFGDSNSSTDENPSHTYASDGVYNVQLTATNGCGSVTTSQVITITTGPSAAFSANTQSGCASLVVQFNDQSSANATSWNWSFPGGTPATSTAQNPTVTYNAAGTFDVSLSVGNAAGSNLAQQVAYISVNDVPTSSFTAQVNGTVVNLTNNSGNATSYNWDFGDGNSSTDANPSNTYAGDGSYTITLTATNECGSVQFSQVVTIVTAPTSGFSASTQTGCAPETIQFTSQASANTTSWNWSFPGGTPATSTDQNPVVTYNTAGSYNVSLQVSNAAGSDQQQENAYVIINDVPAAGFNASVNGTQATFSNSSTNANTYSWDFGDGTSSTDANPSNTYPGDGVYTVTLTATNECGSVQTSQTVTIVTAPSAGFSANMQSGCAPMTVQFNDQSSSNTTGWNWSFPGGTPSTSTERNPVVVYSTAGTYTVTLVAANAAGTNQVQEAGYIVVNTVPDASFSAQVSGTSANFNNGSNNANSYSWDFGDGSSSTAANPSHTYSGDGVYMVTLMATNECGSIQTTQMVTIVTAPTAGFSANMQSGCAPLTVQFSDQSSVNATSWNWSFPGGTPATSTDQNPQVVYNTAGSYNVTLEVSNAAGSNEAAQTSYIVVETVPTADFSTANFGTTVEFTNNSVNANSYLWDFGDGNSSTDANPSHVYSMDGSYTVTLTAINDCGEVITTQTVDIVTPPNAGFSADINSGCAPMTVQFNDLSSTNTTGWSWSFPGGTPATSTDQNPVVVYNTPGVYNVSLVATTAAGSSTFSQPSYIIVKTTPVAAFSSTTTGTTTDFTNNTTGAISYSWDFGDGNSSTDVNPTHTYAMDGQYSVVLTATNECGDVTSSETVTIVTAPTAGFSANTTSGCAPMAVQFSDQSSSNATNWEWTFTGGTPATSVDQNPSVVYNTPGVYTVRLVASNSAGTDVFEQLAYIEVKDGPTAGFNTLVEDNKLTATNTSNNSDSYLWLFGDGNSSTDPNPVYNYAASGQYDVMLIATNECGSDTLTQTIVVTVVSQPVAEFGASITNGCAPLIVIFNDQSSVNTTSWQWTFDGGNPATSTDRNPVVTYDTPGTYAVTLVAFNSAGSNSNTKVGFVTVAASPVAGFTRVVDNTTVEFTNNSTDGNAYAWDFGDGNSSTEENPIHQYAMNGTYTVTLVVTNDCGSDTLTQTVEINDGLVPQAGLAASAQNGCAPFEVFFTDISGGNPSSWEWSFQGGDPATSTQQNPVITYNTAGTYDVRMIAVNQNGRDTVTLQSFIVVDDVPVAGFDFTLDNAEVTFDNNSTSGNTYFWDFGDGTTSTEEAPVHTYGSSGNFEVQLVVTNACGSDTTSQVVSIEITSIQDPAFVSELTLFPNPNSGQFTLIMKGEARGDLTLQFGNILGQEIFEEQVSFRSGNLVREFDFSRLAAGTYLLRIRSDQETAYRKVVIE